MRNAEDAWMEEAWTWKRKAMSCEKGAGVRVLVIDPSGRDDARVRHQAEVIDGSGQVRVVSHESAQSSPG